MDDLNRVNPKRPKVKLLLTTSIPPSVNHIYVNTKRGGKRLSKDAERWIRELRGSVLAQIEDQGWKKEGLGVWLKFEMTFYFPDKRRRDNHNSFKILFDALNGITYVDDYYVLPSVKDCFLDKLNPRVEITITPKTYKVSKIDK